MQTRTADVAPVPTWIGETLRWYLTRARHPFKNYIVGHYWGAFCAPRVWVRYDESAVISVQLADWLQARIFFDGYYERPLVAWLKSTLKTGDVFWDVGANIGAVSLVAAALCGRVVAFEPDPPSLALLKKHVDANLRRPVDIRAFALAAHNGTSTLYQSSAGNTGRNSIVPGWATPAGEVRVRVRRGDDVIAADPTLAPTVIKLDVEGAEAQVLEGCRDLLASRHVRAIVFEDRVANGRPATAAVVEAIERAGYAISPLGPSVESASDAEADSDTFNFLAVPRSSGSASR